MGPMMGGMTGDRGVPAGTRIALDRRARLLDGGAALLGGAPPRLLQLSERARALLGAGALTVADPTSAALARRLLDAGIAHPVRSRPRPCPRRPRSPSSSRSGTGRPGWPGCSAAAAGRGRRAWSWSTTARPTRPRSRRVAGAAGARVLRHPASRGPAAARNAGLAAAATPLVAFLDSDVVPEPGWLEPLLAAFADPAVGWPRRGSWRCPRSPGWLGRYEAVRSSLDLGPDPALVCRAPGWRTCRARRWWCAGPRPAPGSTSGCGSPRTSTWCCGCTRRGWRLRYVAGRPGRARPPHVVRGLVAAQGLLRHRGGAAGAAAPGCGAADGAHPDLGRDRRAAADRRPVGAAAGRGARRGGRGARLARRLRVRRPHRHRGPAGRARARWARPAQTADAVNRHYWPLSAAGLRCSPGGPGARCWRRAGRGGAGLVAAPRPRRPGPARPARRTCSPTGSTTWPTAPGCGGAPGGTAPGSRCARPVRVTGIPTGPSDRD